MDKLKPRYKLLIAIISLIAISPIFVTSLYISTTPDFINNIPLIQNLSVTYNINLNECLKCQDNGLVFGAIFILSLVLMVLLSIGAMLTIVSLLLKPLLGWSVSSTFSILLKGNYPEEWKT